MSAAEQRRRERKRCKRAAAKAARHQAHVMTNQVKTIVNEAPPAQAVQAEPVVESLPAQRKRAPWVERVMSLFK